MTAELAKDTAHVGVLHYPGDTRKAGVAIYSTPKYGRVYPYLAEYDEATNRTTVSFAGKASWHTLMETIELVQP